MPDSTKNLALLRKCGIPEWILIDEQWTDFITFFKENITDANILTDEELVELAHKNGNGIGIKKRMDDIAKNYSGIWSITKDDLSDLERTIEIISQEEDFYEDLIVKAKAANLEAIEELTSSQKQKARLLSEEPIVVDKCVGHMEELQEAKRLNERKISELGYLYSKPVQNPLFMHQMPLNEYFRQLEQLNNDARHFLQKNFKVQNNDGKVDADDIKKEDASQALTDLGVVADRLLNAYNKLYLSEMNFNAKTVLTNHFKAQNWSPSTLMGMRREMMQMKRDIELNGVQKEHLIYKLQEQAIEMAQLDVDALVYESNQKRMSRAKQRMEYLTQFADVISESMTLSEILWTLLQLDMERMKNRNNFDSKLDAYRMESLGCNRRIELMNMIGKLNADASIQYYCNQFMNLLQINLNDYAGSDNDRIIKCILSGDEFKSSIFKMVQYSTKSILTSGPNLELFKKASFIESFIRQFLYDGPVAKPQQYSAWYRKKSAQLDREYAIIREKNELAKGECSHIIKKWSNDKYWRQKQVLWVWFLTEPKKVIKSLKYISCEAQQKSKTAAIAPRHIAGIVRKN